MNTQTDITPPVSFGQPGSDATKEEKMMKQVQKYYRILVGVMMICSILSVPMSEAVSLQQADFEQLESLSRPVEHKKPQKGLEFTFEGFGEYTLVAQEAKNGKEIWRSSQTFYLDAFASNQVTVDETNKLVYLVENDRFFGGTLYALDYESGKIVWHIGSESGQDARAPKSNVKFRGGQAFLYNGKLFVSAEDKTGRETMVRVDPANQTVDLIFDRPDIDASYSITAYQVCGNTLVATFSTVHYVPREQTSVSYELSSGKIVNADVNGNCQHSAMPDNGVLFGSDTRHLVKDILFQDGTFVPGQQEIPGLEYERSFMLTEPLSLNNVDMLSTTFEISSPVDLSLPSASVSSEPVVPEPGTLILLGSGLLGLLGLHTRRKGMKK